MTAQRKETISFSLGRHFYQIAKAYDGSERFVGLKDGRVVGMAHRRAEVAKMLIANAERVQGSDAT